jgi:site-specific DNA recombinase
LSETLHIYTRVSSIAQQDDGTSLVTQREQGERKAKELGMLSKVWNEGAQSSRHEDLEKRPILKELLGLIDSGEVKQLWVYAPDRLSRNESTWALIRHKLNKQNVTLHTSSGIFSFSHPMDKLLFGVLAEFSTFENSQRADRSKTGKLNRISQGYWMGGPPPYGYKVEGKKLVPDKTEAKWVNFIFQSYRDGRTINEIRGHLLEHGVATRRSKKSWSHGSIDKLLTNTHYAGSYTIKAIPCVCEPIVPTTLFRAVADAKKKRSERRIREGSQKHFSLLTNFFVCGHCGCRFGARHNPKQGRAVYYCRRKELNYVNKGTEKEKQCSNSRYLKMGATDDLVCETVLNVLLKSPLFESETKDEISSRKRSEEDHAQETSRLKKQLSHLDREIRQHGETMSRVKAETLLNSKSPKEVAKIIKNIEEIVTGLKTKQEALVAKIKTHESDDDWDDWVYKHGQLLDHLIDLEPKDQLFVFNHVLKSIVVETIDTRSHRLTINFKLPYYSGRFDPINPKKPSQGAKATGGKDLIEITLQNAKKNSKKRDS